MVAAQQCAVVVLHDERLLHAEPIWSASKP
jgi:hypothetical protein